MRKDIIEKMSAAVLDSLAAGVKAHDASANELVSASLTASKALLRSVVGLRPDCAEALRLAVYELLMECTPPTAKTH